MISHKYKFIFIHIPKTAGMSIDKKFTNTRGICYKTDYEGLWHYTTEEIIEKFGDGVWDEYTSFTVVRNPWDRMVSEYSWQRQQNWGNRDISFFDFCKCNYDWYPEKEKLHLKTQFSFCIDSAKTFRIGNLVKFENLQEGLNIVCDKIGIPHQKLRHINKSKHKHYTEYYDDENRQIVAEKFAKDIEYFGYKFGE